LASPLDPDASGVIGWALSGIAAVFTGLIHYLYKRLRKLNEIETGQIVEAELQQFESQRIMPALSKLEGRLANVERLEARLGAIQTHVEHLTDGVSDLKGTVEKNAVEAAKQLTGAMNRIADQRKEDNEIQLERIDSVKELIQAQRK
jgi:hypothetical protein